MRTINLLTKLAALACVWLAWRLGASLGIGDGWQLLAAQMWLGIMFLGEQVLDPSSLRQVVEGLRTLADVASIATMIARIWSWLFGGRPPPPESKHGAAAKAE